MRVRVNHLKIPVQRKQVNRMFWECVANSINYKYV